MATSVQQSGETFVNFLMLKENEEPHSQSLHFADSDEKFSSEKANVPKNRKHFLFHWRCASFVQCSFLLRWHSFLSRRIQSRSSGIGRSLLFQFHCKYFWPQATHDTFKWQIQESIKMTKKLDRTERKKERRQTQYGATIKNEQIKRDEMQKWKYFVFWPSVSVHNQ